MKVFGKRLFIRELEEEEIKIGLLVMKESDISKEYISCEVLAIGDECVLELKAGDTVLVKLGKSGTLIQNKDYIIEDEDVLGVKDGS